MAGLLPLQITLANGPVANTFANANAALISLATAEAPGLTADLPGTLVEDMASTASAAVVIQDQARVDAVNSVTPYGANPYVLAQLGQQFGIAQGTPTNGNALVTFTGTAGYVIPPGFLVGDGTNTYIVQDGAIIGTGGTIAGVFVVANNPNTFAIAANQITTVITPTPGFTTTVTNPLAGNPAQTSETVESYRFRVMESFQNTVQGVATYIKSLLYAAGASQRLVSVIQSGSDWEVITSGADPYAMAYAIYQGITTPGFLAGASAGGSTVNVSIVDTPNTYTIKYVNPAAQVVTGTISWNTNLANFTSGAIVDQLMTTASTNYINSIVVGQPINLLEWTALLQQAIATTLDPVNLTTLVFVVKINGSITAPTAGTSIIPGDIESYFTCANGAVVVTQA